MSSHGQNKLTTFIKRLLDIAWFIFVGVAILWPITAAVVGLNFFFDAETRNVDVFISFKIYPDLLQAAATESAGAVDAFIHGLSNAQINTPSQFAWYMSAAISEVSLFIFLFGLAQMRALFASLVSGASLTPENAGRIKTIGFVIIGWHVFVPLMQYFGGRAMLADINLQAQGVQLFPAFESNVSGLFVGLAVLVLSGVLREAANIQKDQQLTI